MNLFELEHNVDFKVENIVDKQNISKIYKLNIACIAIVVTGNCKLLVNMAKFEMTENSTIIFFPGDIVEFISTSDDINITLVMIGKNLLEDLFARLEHNIIESFYQTRWIGGASTEDEHKFFLNIIYNVTFIYHNQTSLYRYEQILGQLRSLICYSADMVRKAQLHDGLTKYTRVEEHFRTFMNLLNTYYKESREVSYYAEKMHISAKYLNNICNTITSKTSKAIIDRYIIIQLKNELRTSQLSIQEIAYKYNFTNQSFLGCYFKKFVGVSPRKYRNGEALLQDNSQHRLI